MAEKDLEKGEVLECPICYLDIQENEEQKITTCCQNKFHEMCLDAWLEKGTTCPMCRTVIADHVANNNTGR